jgi:predicted lipoprotein with Yx(FWY)xxD motif
MKRGFWMMGLLLLPLPPLAPALAAPVAAKTAASQTRTYPAQVGVRKRAAGFYYVNARGLTLYALNQRVAFTRSGGSEPYCVGPCTKVWTEAAAPANAKPVGDWSVVPGLIGPQWAYRKNPVFTYTADKAPGQTLGEAYDDLWTVIAHIPPAPSLTAPPTVSARLVKDQYVLTDGDGHALFTPAAKGPCEKACADWTPLLAGLSARDVGGWSVERGGPQARWRYRGQDVFVSPRDDPAAVPDGGQMLRP